MLLFSLRHAEGKRKFNFQYLSQMPKAPNLNANAHSP